MSKKPRRTHTPEASSYPSTLNPGDPPPEGFGHRQARLEHILLDEIQRLIRDEATDPSLDGVLLLSLHLSPDGGHARIAYAVLAPLGAEAQRGRRSKEGLARATGFLRARLAELLNLKKLPKLSFTFVGVQQAGGEPCPD